MRNDQPMKQTLAFSIISAMLLISASALAHDGEHRQSGDKAHQTHEAQTDAHKSQYHHSSGQIHQTQSQHQHSTAHQSDKHTQASDQADQH